MRAPTRTAPGRTGDGLRATPTTAGVADAMAAAAGPPTDYLPVPHDGAARAADLLARPDLSRGVWTS